MGKQKPKTSIIAQMSAKAMDSLYARISNLLDSYYLKIIVSEPNEWNDVETESRLDYQKRLQDPCKREKLGAS